MIFLYVGLALVAIAAFIYALIKWIIPGIPVLIKKVKAKKEQKKQKELEDNTAPNVELATGSHKFAGKEEVSYSQNYQEVAYLQEDDNQEKKEANNEQEQESGEDEEFQQFLKNFKKNNDKDIKTQIKTSSPKLKAILMSGALQDKKYID